MPSLFKRAQRGLVITGLLVALLVAYTLMHHSQGADGLPMGQAGGGDIPAPLAIWPWPHAVKDAPHSGVTHWLDTSSPEGTTVELFDFDFAANPHLRLEIYDQDEDDAMPFDNKAAYWPNGVGQVTRHLNDLGRGPVVAAWNGLFFDLNGQGPTALASHLTPVVLRGQIHYTDVGNHRWTFGVRCEHDKPVFKALFLPDRDTLSREFDFAAGAAQCLVREGKPLKLQPFPKPGEGIAPRPAHDTSDEAGYIPVVDHIKVSRASLGWPKDNRHLYLLFVKSPTTETENALKFKHGEPVFSGWDLADLQRFWLAKGVWGAINSDGGGPAQLTYRLPTGQYLLIPPRWAAGNARRTVSADFPNAPAGGALMYFYVRDAN